MGPQVKGKEWRSRKRALKYIDSFCPVETDVKYSQRKLPFLQLAYARKWGFSSPSIIFNALLDKPKPDRKT